MLSKKNILIFTALSLLAGGSAFVGYMLSPSASENERLYAFARKAYVAGEYEESIMYFDRILIADPNHLDSLIGRSAALWLTRDFTGALDSADSALRIAPNDPEAWINRGAALTKLGRPDEAMASFEKTLELRPNDPGAHYNIACAHAMKGEREKALDKLKLAFQIEPALKKTAPTDPDLAAYANDPEFIKLCK